MNSKKFYIVATLVATIYFFNIDNKIYEKFISLNNYLKYIYSSTLTDIENSINQHFYQVERIKKLESELKSSKELSILAITISEELNKLLEQLQSVDKFNPELELINSYSYVSFNNFNRLWINYKIDDNKTHGLLIGKYAAGVCVNKDNKSIAILNSDKSCRYSVSIGATDSPGVMSGSKKNSNLLLVKYIPLWMKIKKGDIVTTSGLDGIFFSGIKVGIVKKINTLPNYLEAEIEPFANTINKKYLYIIK